MRCPLTSLISMWKVASERVAAYARQARISLKLRFSARTEDMTWLIPTPFRGLVNWELEQ